MPRSHRASLSSGIAPRRYSRIPYVVIAIVLLAVCAFVFGRSRCGSWARSVATRQINQGAISDALKWLDRADRIAGQSGETYLLRARCYRHLRQAPKREQALALAEKFGAPADSLENELLIGRIQSGEMHEEAANYIPVLSDAGIPPNEIGAALVLGSLARGETQHAGAMLDGWAHDMPNEAHVSYVRGLLWQQRNELDKAIQAQQEAIALQPSHELAQLALASLYVQSGQLDKAHVQYCDLASRYPRNQLVLVGLATVLRQRGLAQSAHAVLEPIASGPEPDSQVALEMGQIEFELGHYSEAAEWLQHVAPDDMAAGGGLPAAVNTLALEGRTVDALGAIDHIEQGATAIRRMNELQVLLRRDPSDAGLNNELRQLVQSLRTRLANQNPLQEEPVTELENGGARGDQLYALHCQYCHGASGDGKGRAARHLYPRPRDLRNDRMRLVSSRNGIPTLDDITSVIKSGMPGTSMPANDQLTEDELRLLAETVLEMRRDGIRQRLEREMAEAGEPIDQDELDMVVDSLTTPGEVVELPPIGPATEDSIRRGREVYTRQTCDSCHGPDGTGDDNMPLFDESGYPVAPADLVNGVFKGGNDPRSISLRVLLGMPGSPHPANIITDDALIDLVHFVQSLSKLAPQSSTTNNERALEAYHRPVLPL